MRSTTWRVLVGGAAALFVTAGAAAQTGVAVTSIYDREADLRLTDASGSEHKLDLEQFTTGTLKIVGGGQVMANLFGSGSVLFISGPAEIAFDETDGATTFELRSGTILIASGERTQAAPIRASLVAGSGKVSADLTAGGDLVECKSEPTALSVAYWAGRGDGSIRVNAGGKASDVGSALRLTLADGKVTIAPAGTPSISVIERLSVVACRQRRGSVEDNLFRNIISWDRFAGADAVIPQLSAGRTAPEIRQVTQTVTVTNNVSNRGQTIQTVSTLGANSVPILSPASLVFQTGDALAAVLANNAQAGILLSLTGSQGLGFGGLIQLGVPGISGGVRTIGPAGLGGR